MYLRVVWQKVEKGISLREASKLINIPQANSRLEEAIGEDERQT